MESEKLSEQWGQIWAQVKSYPDIDASQVDAIFSRLEAQAMSDSFLMLTADNDFIKQWVERNYADAIVRALRDLTGASYAVAIATFPAQNQQATPTAPAQGTPVHTPQPAQPLQPVQATPAQPAGISAQPTGTNATGLEGLNPEPAPQPAPAQPYTTGTETTTSEADSPTASSSLTFENFVVGDSNRMAYSMALEVAENPGRTALNPLFIYGKSGLGKTHLMCSIQNYVGKMNPNLRCIFVDMQDFISKYSEAGAVKDHEKTSFINFRDQYEQADVLLLDDVQYLQGKKESTNMLFQLFNKLTKDGKQIVLSADRAPKSIDIDDRMTSRLGMGAVIDIQPPEVETKLGIVKSFTKEYARSEGLGDFTLSNEIQMYIAENSGSNVRELKSAVNTVIYRMVYGGRGELGLDEVRELLAPIFTGGISRAITVEDIQREVENWFKVTHSDMVSKKRSQHIVRPRQIAIYLCRHLLDLPYDAIGKKFNRDHATAMYATRAVEERLKTDIETQGDVEVLQKIIHDLD